MNNPHYSIFLTSILSLKKLFNSLVHENVIASDNPMDRFSKPLFLFMLGIVGVNCRNISQRADDWNWVIRLMSVPWIFNWLSRFKKVTWGTLKLLV